MAKKSQPPSDLKAHLGFWLRYISNHVSQAFESKLATCGILIAEWVVLSELFRQNGLTPSELSARLGMTRGGVTKLVNRLESKGLLARVSSQSDRRSQTLQLSTRGKALVPRLADLADKNEDEFFGHMTAAKRKLLRKMLTNLVAHHGLRVIPIQ